MPAYDDDSRYVRSNYALVKDLGTMEKTPQQQRGRFADESAITSGGRGRKDDKRPHGSPLRETPERPYSRSPIKYDQEAVRRERLERNKDIDRRHASAVGSA